MMKGEDKLLSFSQEIERGLKLSFNKLLAYKTYKNTPLIISKKDEIVEIYPKEFEDYFLEKAISKPYKKETAQNLAKEALQKPKKDKS